MKQYILILITLFNFAIAFSQNSDPYAIFGHVSNVKYETPIIETFFLNNKDTNSIIKALAFDIENHNVKVIGQNNTLLQELNITPTQMLRWLSTDPHASSYPGLTPYNFVGNMPIRAVDPDGKDIYILFYTSGNKRGDEMFQAAALTRRADIERGKNFDPAKDKVVVLAVQDLATIQAQVNSTVEALSPQYGKTAEFGIWSHGALAGPTGTAPTSQDAVDSKQMTLDGWNKINFNFKESGAVANFYGCRTGVDSYTPDPGCSMLTQTWSPNKSFAWDVSTLANFSNVMVSGQTSSAFPSLYTNYRQNSEAGADNFITGQTDKMIYFQHTYMVGGYQRSEDLNMNEQNVANPMQNNINGQTTGTSYQPGTTR